MEGFTVGVVEPHQNFVGFKHFDPDHFLRLVLGWQVCQALRARNWLADNVEHLIEAHRLQKSRDVFVGGDNCRQQTDFLA